MSANGNHHGVILTLLFVLLLPGLLYLGEHEIEANLDKMSRESLREVTGKSIIDFRSESGSKIDYTYTTTSQTSCGWYSCNTNTFTYTTTYRDQTDITFDRIEIDGSLKFEGGISSARLGYYDDSGDLTDSIYTEGGPGGEVDLKIDDLDITGSGDGTSATLENPFVELAFRNQGDPSNQELLGLRIGTESVDGNLRFQLDQLSGTVHAACTGVASIACSNIVENEHRTDNSLVNLANTFGFDAVLQFNDTKDFWLSLNRDDIVWEHNNPIVTSTPGDNVDMSLDSRQFHTDGKGFWLHLTNDVTGGI